LIFVSFSTIFISEDKLFTFAFLKDSKDYEG